MTDGFFDLVFKAELFGKWQAGCIAGYTRLRLPDFAITPTGPGRLEKLPAYRQVEQKSVARQWSELRVSKTLWRPWRLRERPWLGLPIRGMRRSI